jgi:hypothetical protein
VTVGESNRTQTTGFPFKGNAIQTAKRLQDFTHSIQTSGLLVSEETFMYLSPVKGQFTLGRQGLTSFPWEKSQKMVYEVVGRKQPLIQTDAPRMNFWGVTTRRKTIVPGSDWLAIGQT